MIYDFTKAIKFDIRKDMDIKELEKKLNERFNSCENDTEIIVKLKQIIKKDSDFKEMLSDFDMELNEFIETLIYIYPELFNSHIIKYLRKTYIFNKKEDSELAKL